MMSESLLALDYSKDPRHVESADLRGFRIQPAMQIFRTATILVVGYMCAPFAGPAFALAPQTATQTTTPDDVSPLVRPGTKVSLLRGIVKQVDPIHDQLLLRSFGGGEIKVAFDTRTQLLPEKTGIGSSSIPAGSVISVDTVMENGKLFAVSVRKSASNSAELDGQVLRYDAAKSELVVRDRMSPDAVTLRVSPNTTITNQGQPASAQALLPGMLVRISFSAAQDTANKVEIFAARGTTFTFQGRIVGLDLRTHVLTLSNDTDQSLRELAFNPADAANLQQLHEGAEVSIRAEFDGDRYNIHSVTPVKQNP